VTVHLVCTIPAACVPSQDDDTPYEPSIC